MGGRAASFAVISCSACAGPERIKVAAIAPAASAARHVFSIFMPASVLRPVRRALCCGRPPANAVDAAAGERKSLLRFAGLSGRSPRLTLFELLARIFRTLLQLLLQ